MKKRKILLYGCGEIYARNKHWISTIYDVVGAVDKKWETSGAMHGFYNFLTEWSEHIIMHRKKVMKC